MKRSLFTICFALACMFCVAQTSTAQDSSELEKDEATVRFATFNISFNRKTEGKLKSDLAKGKMLNPRRIAEIIQRVRPDVLLLNEFDYDPEGEGIRHFADKFLGVSQNGQPAIEYEFVYHNAVNTGVDSGFDLDGNGELKTGNDAFGYGIFPGQYGMVVLSKYKIDTENIRTFQKFLWKDMPGCLWPIKPASNTPYYSDDIKNVFRLSSKSHWDVPIVVGEKTIHFLVAHPTPPVFDGDEDRNGKRNHDEIRLFADYVTPGKSAYIYDDSGKKGGLAEGVHFVIAGDMNADESDGDSADNAAELLTKHPLINHDMPPKSEGGPYYSQKQGGVNENHKGDPAFDTSDFNDRSSGNMHIDYCLPSKTLTIKRSGIFWPKPDQPGADLIKATDHRMTWVDLEK
ncbi:MAG: endonuclease/exonuclease/phosphatase family protein [Mariniblastus sp.]